MGRNNLIKIKFLCNWGSDHATLMSRYIYQTPNHDGVWNNITGKCNGEDPDFFVIMEGLPEDIQKWQLPAEKRIYFQREPEEIVKEHPFFYDKEALFLGSYGKHYHMAIWQIIKPFNELSTLPFPSKRKKLSAVMSNKRYTRIQQARLDVLRKISMQYPEIDIYGRGLSSVDFGNSYKGELAYNRHCKFRGLINYEYSLAIENSAHENYFTEKLIDCFLSWTKPLYWGCPNLEQYFPVNSYAWIDIDSPYVVDMVMEEVSKPIDYNALREARELVLYKYNLWPSIQNILQDSGVLGK